MTACAAAGGQHMSSTYLCQDVATGPVIAGGCCNAARCWAQHILMACVARLESANVNTVAIARAECVFRDSVQPLGSTSGGREGLVTVPDCAHCGTHLMLMCHADVSYDSPSRDICCDARKGMW